MHILILLHVMPVPNRSSLFQFLGINRRDMQQYSIGTTRPSTLTQATVGVFVFLVFRRTAFGFTYLATCRTNLDVAFEVDCVFG
jgi:hypothetical protein